jgi:hypothetical protein
MELLFLTVEGQTVDIFGAGDMGQERRRGIALRQDLRRLLGQFDMAFAAGQA